MYHSFQLQLWTCVNQTSAVPETISMLSNPLITIMTIKHCLIDDTVSFQLSRHPHRLLQSPRLRVSHINTNSSLPIEIIESVYRLCNISVKKYVAYAMRFLIVINYCQAQNLNYDFQQKKQLYAHFPL